MLNCYTARVVPPEHASGVLADIRGGNGKQKHHDGDAANGPTKKTEIVSASRADGRGPYDLRQVCLWSRHYVWLQLKCAIMGRVVALEL